MPAMSRLGDKAQAPADAHGCLACPHPVTGPAITGAQTVLINSKPALRLGDMGKHAPCCGPNIWQPIAGSSTVMIEHKPAVRVGDTTQHCGGVGQMVEGSKDVIVGG